MSTLNLVIFLHALIFWRMAVAEERFPLPKYQGEIEHADLLESSGLVKSGKVEER